MVVLVITGVLIVLFVTRLVLAVPNRVRRMRRPESRSVRVIGVGGAGSNAIDRMLDERIPGVDFVACNTDAQALRRSRAPRKIRIGHSITRGLGSGGNPDVGRRSAEDDVDVISDAIAGSDLVFITAGLGGGTGSGAAPVVAAKAREQGALTIGVVTKPFRFEGTGRQRIAEEAARQLTSQVDALITIPNDRMSAVVHEDASMLDAFGVVDGVLLETVQGIINLLNAPGLINLDFADIRAVMQDAGPAFIGLGRGSGENRAVDAARQAIASPLLEARIDSARAILFSVSGPADLQFREVSLAADEIRAMADADANVIFGANFGAPIGEDVRITLIATGLDGSATSEPGLTEAAVNGSRDRGPNRRSRRSGAALEKPSARKKGSTPAPDTPTAMPDGAPATVDEAHPVVDDDHYEVPSFLRRGRTTPNGGRP